MIQQTEWGRQYLSITATEINPEFSKAFPLKQIFPNHMTKDDFLTDPWTSHLSHRLHPFTHTWVHGHCLHSPYVSARGSLINDLNGTRSMVLVLGFFCDAAIMESTNPGKTL